MLSRQRGHVRDIHPSLSACGLSPIPVSGGGSGLASLALGERGATVRNVQRCHSPWACPICSPRIAARRAEALIPQIQKMREEGGSNYLVTLTIRHQKQDDLAKLLDGIRKTWGAVTSGKAWKNQRDKGRIEYARGFDVTWSRGNGWHPHLHLSLFLGAGHKNPESVARWIVDRWIKSLSARGYSATLEAQDFQRCDDVAKAAAYAITPAAVYEALAMASKRARGKGAGLTPFEILSFAVKEKTENKDDLSQRQALLLWREYVSATKGRRQAVTSQGLHLVPDEDCDEIGKFDEVALLSKEVLKGLDWQGKTVHLFQAIEDARGAGLGAAREAARRFLSGCNSGAWWIVDDPPRPSPPPARPPDG